MIPEAYVDFINTIIDKTNENEVEWIPSSEKVFILRTKKSTVEIGHYTDPDAELSYYYFQFYNIKNKSNAGFRVNNQENGYSRMETLYTLAAASAGNIKDELESFLDDL